MAEPQATQAWRTQRDVALHLVKLAEAGQDCRDRLDAVRRLLKSQGVKADWSAFDTGGGFGGFVDEE